MESSEQSMDVDVESAMREIYPNELRDDQEEDGLECWQPSRKEPAFSAKTNMAKIS